MNIQERAIENALNHVKYQKAHSDEVEVSLRRYLKAKFKYCREVMDHDPSWKEQMTKFQEHILSNIPDYANELYLNLSSEIDNVLNDPYYNYSESDINYIIIRAEERALAEYLMKF